MPGKQWNQSIGWKNGNSTNKEAAQNNWVTPLPAYKTEKTKNTLGKKVILSILCVVLVISAIFVVGFIQQGIPVDTASTDSILSNSSLLSTSSKAVEKTFEEIFASENGLTVDSAKSVLSACVGVGVPQESIELEKIDDWANGQRYRFNYKSISVVIYLNSDGTVNSINSGDVKFYENGVVICNVNDRIVDDDMKVVLKIWAEDAVKSNLISPSTADFPGGFLTPYEDWTFSRDKDQFYVASYVDAQNAFGAVVRNNFVVSITWDGDTNHSGTITDVSLG